jgi:general secretion pathway protein A
VFRHTDGVPRRINTLSSRVLLYGALEGTSLITGKIVDDTASDLQRDLGAVTDTAGQAPPGAAEADTAQVLLPRIQALEAGVARQERIFRRLLDLLGSYLEPQRPTNVHR